MLVEHLSMSAFSWKQFYSSACLVPQHCVADAADGAGSGRAQSCLENGHLKEISWTDF